MFLTSGAVCSRLAKTRPVSLCARPRERPISRAGGHRFVAYPVTNNVYYIEITAVGDSSVGKQVLGGRAYGSPDQPCILMRANLGIPFDLAEIASLNPASRIDRFRTAFGVSESGTERPCHADFWVLGTKLSFFTGNPDATLAQAWLFAWKAGTCIFVPEIARKYARL